MHIDRDRARRAFDDYTAAYDPSVDRIRLKIDHTLRVAELCDRIARSLGLDVDDVDLAWLCGLVHDIGRFEQVRQYGTFNDAQSFPHARMGADVLFGEGLIRRFVDDDSDDDLIRTVVALHSDWRLPEGLGERERLFCDILRDADKVDIIKATQLEPVEAIFGVDADELAASAVSPAVVDAFYAHRTVRRDERAHPADYVVAFACFVFEIVHLEALRAAHEQGHVYDLLCQPFQKPATSRAFAMMEAHMREWVAKRLDDVV